MKLGSTDIHCLESSIHWHPLKMTANQFSGSTSRDPLTIPGSGSLAIMRWVRDTGDSRTLSTTIYKYLQLSTTIAASPEISGFPSHSDHSAVSAPRHDQLQISRDIANNTAIILDRKRSIGHQSQFVEIYTIYLFWWMKHFVEQCFWLIFSSIMDIWNVM